jgi:cbb3-type cytochrome oxidase subunit 3
MSSDTLFIFGSTLCAALAGIIAFYYSRRRKDRVEDAKYKMLEDDDSPVR